MDILDKINKLELKSRTLLDIGCIEGVSYREPFYYVTLNQNCNIKATETVIRENLPELQFRFIHTSNRKITEKSEDNKISPLAAKQVIYIVSGKGGVGKSTIAALIALKLKDDGLKIGLLDADIYGPSVPTLFNIHDLPEVESGKIIPHMKDGLSLMSVGFLIDENKALAWRGLMVQKALKQMLFQVDWGYHADGELDVLIIDTPPGTGDVHLTLAKNITNISSSLIITTPQKLAWIDANRAIALMKKLDINIIGVIENMAKYMCEDCGHQLNIFPRSEVKKEAKIIAQLPIDHALSGCSDEGMISEYSKVESHINISLGSIVTQICKITNKSNYLPDKLIHELH